MTFFVYISDACMADAKQFAVTEHLHNLVESIERDQAFWQLEAFEYPFWVKKRLGNRHTRLVCRLESQQMGSAHHHVLVCLRILQRGSRDYQQLFFNIKKHGEELYRQQDFSALPTWLDRRCQNTEISALPNPSEQENGFIYAVRAQHQYTELHHQRDMMYDSWSWVEQSAALFDDHMLEQVALRLQQAVDTLPALIDHSTDQTAVYPLGEYVGYRVLLVWFAAHQLSCLSLEPVNEKSDLALSERHLSVAQLRHAAHTHDFEQFQQMLSRTARRVYPQLTCLSGQDWLTLQHDQAANLALSPEEAEILSVAQRFERPFPLFINGRAGSGKSTILQCLFADYLYYALQQRTDSHPIYFSCNQKLADRASEMVLQIVQHSCRYHDQPQHADALKNLNLHQMRQYCVEFRQFLYQQLTDQERARFSVGRLVEYGQFRDLWDAKFGRQRDAQQHYPASLCWHVIRCYIKGTQADEYLEPEDYAELGEELKHIPLDLFRLIFHKVWTAWYAPLCKQQQYWDDQDLVRSLLQADRLKPQFPAIFCDEAQDFTRVELQAILRLNLFTGRSIATHSIQRIPLVFAGDQFQTLNPTGFRWESIKAQVVEQFIFALDPAHQTRLSEISYRELTYNFRCSHSIAYFSNLIHGLRAKLFGLKQLKPQRSWHSHDAGRDVVFVDMNDPHLYLSLASQYDLVFVVPCVDGAELDYLRQDPILSVLIKQREHGGTSIPILSVNRAKGLEFSRVVVYGFAQDCPNELRLDGSSDWSDGQKIHVEYYLNRLYVATTRARSQLLLLDRAQDYQAFWSAFAHPLDEPLQLGQLQTEDTDWIEHLGRLRQADLDDLTPDADQIRTMQKNAEQMQQQGWEQRDAYFLQQAAGLYQQLGLGYEIAHQRCLAQVAYLEQRFAEAAQLFLRVDESLWAFESNWRAQDWSSAYQILQHDTALSDRLEREFLALSQRERCTPHAYVQAVQSLLSHLEKTAQQPANPLNEDVASQSAWQQLIMLVLNRLPMDVVGSIWREVYRLSHALDRQANRYAQIPASYLAEFAYLSEHMAEACQHWETARTDHKLQPPTPRYEHAVIASRDFPDNLEALLKLQEYQKLQQAMLAHTDPNSLNAKVWSASLDALYLHDPAALKQVLAVQLPRLTEMSLFDTLISKLQSKPIFATLYKRVEQLKLLRACTEGQWLVVQTALNQLLPTHQQLRTPEDMQALLKLANPNKKQKKQLQFQPDPKLLLILQGLARSEPYSDMVLEDRLNDSAQGIMSALKEMFQHTIPNPTPPNRQRQVYAKHIKVWRTDFDDVRLLGAVIERSNQFIEALNFYEDLEKTDPAYARQRWLACKLRQADHGYRMRDDYRRRASDAVDTSLKQDYERRAQELDDNAERYMKAARDQRKHLNLGAQDYLPEYPELTALSGLIQSVLKIQPNPPAPVLSAAITLPSAPNLHDPAIVPVFTDCSGLQQPVVIASNLLERDLQINDSEQPLVEVKAISSQEKTDPDASNMGAADRNQPTEANTTQANTMHACVIAEAVVAVPCDLVDTDKLLQNLAIQPTDLMQQKNQIEQVVAEQQTKEAAVLPTVLTETDISHVEAARSESFDHFSNPEQLLDCISQHSADTCQSGTAAQQTAPTSHQGSVLAPEWPELGRVSVSGARLPDLCQAAKQPKTELIWADYRLTFIRTQQRLNIEHQLTGEYSSVFLRQARVVGDWSLKSLDADASCYELVGTPFYLHLPHAGRCDCVVEVAGYGLQLVLR